MDPSSTLYISYVDSVSHFSGNLSLEAWAIFTTFHTLAHANNVCIGSSTNNQAEYDAVIGLIVNSLSHRILHLHVHLDSLLLIMPLNGVYHVHKKVLFRKYLRVKLLVHEFETITFSHVRIAKNKFLATTPNSIMDWHLSHVYPKR